MAFTAIEGAKVPAREAGFLWKKSNKTPPFKVTVGLYLYLKLIKDKQM